MCVFTYALRGRQAETSACLLSDCAPPRLFRSYLTSNSWSFYMEQVGLHALPNSFDMQLASTKKHLEARISEVVHYWVWFEDISSFRIWMRTTTKAFSKLSLSLSSTNVTQLFLPKGRCRREDAAYKEIDTLIAFHNIFSDHIDRMHASTALRIIRGYNLNYWNSDREHRCWIWLLRSAVGWLSMEVPTTRIGLDFFLTSSMSLWLTAYYPQLHCGEKSTINKQS